MRTHTRILGMQVFMFALASAGCTSADSDQGALEPPNEMGETTDETVSAECECYDQWEPNPDAQKPSVMSWDSVDEWIAHLEISDAGLCAGEDDWYAFEVESLAYTEHYLYIRALIEDAGLCGADCDQPVLMPGPRHAMTVEVYRADDMMLLATETRDDGVLSLNGSGGEPYAHDLLIHVFSPTPDAEYPYRLSVQIRNYDGEDECEC